MFVKHLWRYGEMLPVPVAVGVSCMAAVVIQKVDSGIKSGRHQLQCSASLAVLRFQIQQLSLGVGW